MSRPAIEFANEVMERYLRAREVEMMSKPSEWVGHTRLGDSALLIRAIIDVYDERVGV